MFKKSFLFTAVAVTVALGAMVSCNKNAEPVPAEKIVAQDGSISFGLAPDSAFFGVETKSTTAATGITSFKAASTQGDPGSETNSSPCWINVAFTSDGELTPTYKASPAKYWPLSDPEYTFYAVSASESTANAVATEAPDLTFAAAGTYISMAADYDKDVVCAYLPFDDSDSNFKLKNALAFKHIFARVAGVTVTAADDCAISNISISIVNAKTGGTYNLRTGDGQTDGSGWSSLLPASGDKSIYARAAAIASGANDATGSVYDNTTNSLFLVPGTYSLKASWTASVDDYSQTYTNMTSSATINIVGGKINSISCNLTGDASKLEFSVSLAEWTNNSIADVEFDHS